MNVAKRIRGLVASDESVAFVREKPEFHRRRFRNSSRVGRMEQFRTSDAVAVQRLLDYYGLADHQQIQETRRVRRMLLTDELKALECTDSPGKFRERLIEALQLHFPEHTIDDLVCDPRSAIRYCDAVREEAECPELHDGVILKTLMNIRRAKNCPQGLKKRRTRVSTARVLRELSIDLDVDSFRTLLVDALASMYRYQTIDEILCHPVEALAYCNHIRNLLGCRGLEDSFILRTLVNVRKNA